MCIAVQIALAWAKIQKGIELEAEGRALWIEGTIELIQILDKARNEIASDLAFGIWLHKNGHDNLISPENRSAYLNMALNLDITREVLKHTHRDSPRYIWQEEIQPRLCYVTQPQPESEIPMAEPPKTTRRPKKTKKTKAEKVREYNKATGFEFRWEEPVRAELGKMPDDIREQYEQCIREVNIQLDQIFKLNLYADQMHPEFRIFLASALKYLATRSTRLAKEMVEDLRKINHKDFCGVEIPIRLN